MQKNVLIVSGHPDLGQSVANKTILDAVQAALPQARIRRLDALYPNYQIDVAAEQAALLQVDVIVWQFPLHWYALPALMKKWLDEVFLFGFSHGSATQLAGKTLLISFTSGAKESDYAPGQMQNYPIETFIPAFKQTANLCGLHFAEPIYSGGMFYIPGVHDAQALAAVQAKAKAHAQRLQQALAS